MITEDYVSYKTAKLLKEKGFNESCEGFYVNSDVLSHTLSNANNSKWDEDKSTVGYISAPTLQMAMKWLREKHNLFVFPFPQMNTNKFWVEIYQLSNNQEWENLYCETIDLQDYSFYEEACETGIKYCLENLI